MRLFRSIPRPHVRVTLTATALSAVVALVLSTTSSVEAAPGSAATQPPTGTKPTTVLVHGSFADASGWTGVTQRLQRKGYTVIAPANPLRDLSDDSAYVASVLATIPGPIVLVGHSYGGAVISNAALGNPNVKALVYIAGFALAEGETVFGIVGQFPGSQLPQNILARPYSQGSAGTGIDAYIDPAAFRQVFAADVPAPTAAVMAATQRPGTLASGSEGSGPPAWQSIPTWYLVANQDRAIPPAAERFMAERAHAHTVEIDSSHVAMISHPDVVTDLILNAATATA